MPSWAMSLRILLPMIVAVAMAALPARAGAAGAQTWELDPVHSQIVFFADHLGLSHGIGRLRIKHGWFRFDPEDWSSARADIVIDTASVDMGDAQWSEKVRAPGFLASEKWPTARFIGDRLEPTAKDEGVLHGSLWLRGIRQPVQLNVKFNRIGNDPYAFKSKAGFTATAHLDRFDFGMDTFRDVVAGPVEIRIEVEGVRSRIKKEPEENGDQEH